MKHIPVFCATDDNYAAFASVMMVSVLTHTKSFIDFYVMDGGISSKSKRWIKKDLKPYPNHEVHYVDMKNYDLSRFPNLKHYSTNTFSRYFIPEIAKEYNKIIYLDVDIVVKKDIKLLFDQPLGNYALGAVLEDFYAGNYTTLKEHIWPKYNGGDHYFNAGVLLLDIPKLIKMKFTEKTIELTNTLADKLNCADQDVLNILFENNFQVLDYQFNYMPDHSYMLYTKHPEIGRVDPVIIHYTAAKPWKAVSIASEDFDAVFHNSCFFLSTWRKYHVTRSTTSYYVFGIPVVSITKRHAKRKKV